MGYRPLCGGSTRRRVLARALILVVAVLVVSCGGKEIAAERPAAATEPEPSILPSAVGEPSNVSSNPSWIRYANEEAGYRATYPSHWYRAEETLTPELLDPVEVLAVATYPLRPRGDRCLHHPVNALEDFGRGDAFIALYERAPLFSPSDYPERPRRLSLLLENISDSGRFCVPDPDRLDTWVAFSDGDRAFYLLVAIGKSASAETRAHVNTILDSLRLSG